jgi:hypothetical protein
MRRFGKWTRRRTPTAATPAHSVLVEGACVRACVRAPTCVYARACARGFGALTGVRSSVANVSPVTVRLIVLPHVGVLADTTHVTASAASPRPANVQGCDKCQCGFPKRLKGVGARFACALRASEFVRAHASVRLLCADDSGRRGEKT